MIIQNFIRDQRTAKEIIFNKLGVPVNIKAYDFSGMSSEIRKKYGEDPFAASFSIHGVGISLT